MTSKHFKTKTFMSSSASFWLAGDEFYFLNLFNELTNKECILMFIWWNAVQNILWKLLFALPAYYNSIWIIMIGGESWALFNASFLHTEFVFKGIWVIKNLVTPFW